MTPIRLLREAENELRVAARYYEEAQSGLGRALIAEVRRAREFIAEYPLAARIERSDIRVRSISRFPYRIYYRVRPEEIGSPRLSVATDTISNGCSTTFFRLIVNVKLRHQSVEWSSAREPTFSAKRFHVATVSRTMSDCAARRCLS